MNSANSQNCLYGYDDLARLASVDCGTAIWKQNFSYDPYGNITKTVPTGATGISFASTYSSNTNATNRLTLIGSLVPTYDTNGNLTNDTVHAYTWDAEGKMLTADTTALTYDALGRMVEQNRSGVYTQIVYSPTGSKLALMNGQTLVKAFVALPGGGQAVYQPGTTGPVYYRHGDWLGSSRLATTPTRTKYFDVSYAPFGENYKDSGTTDYSFTGQNQDTMTGYYDFLFRQYSQVEGRWLSPDPAGLAVVGPEDPRTWNRYAYVGNMPLNFVDPLGLAPPCQGDKCTPPGWMPIGSPGDSLTSQCMGAAPPPIVGAPQPCPEPQPPRSSENCNPKHGNCVDTWGKNGAKSGLQFPPDARVYFQTEPKVTLKQWFHAALDCLLSPDPLPTTKPTAGDSPAESGDRLDGNSLDRSNQIYLPKPNGQQVAVTGDSSPGLNGAADAAGLELGWAGCMKQEVGGPGLWP